MPVESAADRASFLSADEFGVTASFTPASGGATIPLTGIFDNDYLDLDVEGEVGVASRSPRFVAATADLDAAGGASDGATLELTLAQLQAAGLDVNFAGTYKVRIVKPDGTGMTELKLEKQ
jgi:hypothetical protein